MSTTEAASQPVAFAGDVNAAAAAIASYKSGGVELVIYESGNIGNGSQANNPLLQELPDPITKAVWDHYVTVSPKDAAGIDFSESITKYCYHQCKWQIDKASCLGSAWTNTWNNRHTVRIWTYEGRQSG